MSAPEAYIHFREGLITGDGEVTDASTEEFLRNYMREFCQFVERVLTVLPSSRQRAGEAERPRAH
jgi:chromate reductase